MSSAFSIADRIAMVHRGQIVLQGTPQEFRASTDPRVQDFINGIAPEGESLDALLQG
jgi:phospholipid/cholesterol/gamma-HCH transport system ATP-binding protein